MASRGCGCSGSSCSCRVIAGRNARVTGSGNINNPYVIDALPMSLSVQDTPTIDLTLTGSGAVTDPWVISGVVSAAALLNYWKMWTGTQVEYDALPSTSDDTLYLIVP